jgi:ribonucleoside-diphosphate reductase subunit M1
VLGVFGWFLVANKSDSLEDFGKTVKTCAKISQTAGGIGIHLHNVSATGTAWIKYPKHESHGLVEPLKVLNDLAQYIDQGGRVSIYYILFSFNLFL